MRVPFSPGRVLSRLGRLLVRFRSVQMATAYIDYLRRTCAHLRNHSTTHASADQHAGVQATLSLLTRCVQAISAPCIGIAGV